jgi:hypothetical protein
MENAIKFNRLKEMFIFPHQSLSQILEIFIFNKKLFIHNFIGRQKSERPEECGPKFPLKFG